MPGIAQGFFLHIGNVHGFQQGAQAISVEGFKRADIFQLQILRFGKRFLHYILTIFPDTCRTRILFQDIYW